jgi:Universal stress protein UspA and related nucleotide-binding proteins
VVVYCPVANAIEELNRYIGFENYESMRSELLLESEERLEELAEAWGLETCVEWQPVPYKAVLEKAQELSACTIVMSVSEHSTVGDLLHKPDDWHLLREATCPIWLVGKALASLTRVTVAIDVLDEDEEHQSRVARLLDQARFYAQLFDVPLRVVSVLPDPSRMFSDLTVSDSTLMEDFRKEAESRVFERQRLILDRLGIVADSCAVIVGQVDQELRNILTDDGFLALGTSAKTGVKGFFLGNTAERLLHHLDGDMLVVS